MVSIDDVKLELKSNSDISSALQEELINNASLILTTFKGTNPQDRAMGLVSSDILGQNVNKPSAHIRFRQLSSWRNTNRGYPCRKFLLMCQKVKLFQRW